MDSTILSLDIETYGACSEDADGFQLPPQTVFHPVRSLHQDFNQTTPPVRKDGSDRRVLTAAITLVKSPHPTWAHMHEWRYGDTMVFQLHEASHRRLLRQWLSHATILVGMNIAFDLLFLRACGYRDLLSPSRLSLIDLSVINYLHCELRPERSLKDMGVALGTHTYGDGESLKSGFRYPNPRSKALHSYNAQDTINTVVACSELARRIRADHGVSTAKLSDYSLRHYSDVLWTCCAMAEAGIVLDPARLGELETRLLDECALLEKEAEAQHGLILRGTGSAKSKSALLLGAVEEVDALNPDGPSIIDDKRFQRTKANNDLSCTDQNRKLLSLYLPPGSRFKAAFDVWDTHAHNQKIVSSYTFPLLRHARTNPERRDSVLVPVGKSHIAYPSWFACPSQVKDSAGQEGGTEQGRLTCKSPALQTWPEEILGNQFASPPVPSCLSSRYGDEGLIASYDASQVELRVAGLLSGEPRMLEVYQQDRSLHLEMAIHLFGKAHMDALPNAKKSIEYDCGKTANFSSLFRSSAATMRSAALKQSNLDRPLSFFEKIVAGRATAYPVLWAWQEKQIEKACRERRIELPFTGQSRWFWGAPAQVRAAYEQTIVNFPVQTTAANVTIRIQIDLLKRLAAHPDIVQVANIYDAIVFDLPRSKWPILQAAFEASVQHTVTEGYWAMLLQHYGHPMPLKYEHTFLYGTP